MASLIRSVGGADYRLAHTGAFRYAPDAPKIPAGAVTAEDADLIAYLAAQGLVKMHLTLQSQTLADAESYNVIGDLKGSEHPEQIVVVSGHLDSWDLGTGAIDDAAGVAMALQAAQLLQQLHLRPKRTLRVIAWMNEENGLTGGRTYFNYHHTAADTLDKINPRELQENTAVMAVLAYAIADMPEPLSAAMMNSGLCPPCCAARLRLSGKRSPSNLMMFPPGEAQPRQAGRRTKSVIQPSRKGGAFPHSEAAKPLENLGNSPGLAERFRNE